jgi:WD40 repeat protein
VAWSPDGKRMLSGSHDHTVKVWDAEKGQEVLSFKGHTEYVNSVAWSPDGKRILSGSGDKTLKVWDARTGQEVLSLKGHTGGVMSVAWSPDGTRILSGCSAFKKPGELKVWDAEKGQEVRFLKGHTGAVISVAFSLDGKRVSGKDKTGKVLTWDTTTGHLLPDTDPMPQQPQTDAVSPDGSLRAFIDNGQLKVAVVEEQKRQQEQDRLFLERLARPDPAYHRHKADLYEKSSDLFAAAFHLRRMLLIEPKDDAVRKRLAAVDARQAAQAKAEKARPEKPPAKMS